ncbi:unnamed protein product [Lampetra fluviatilis]
MPTMAAQSSVSPAERGTDDGSARQTGRREMAAAWRGPSIQRRSSRAWPTMAAVPGGAAPGSDRSSWSGRRGSSESPGFRSLSIARRAVRAARCRGPIGRGPHLETRPEHRREALRVGESLGDLSRRLTRGAAWSLCARPLGSAELNSSLFPCLMRALPLKEMYDKQGKA